MLLLDILDFIIYIIISIIPPTIVILSLIASYYFYVKSKNENFDNYFCNLGCKLNEKNECKLQLSKKYSFKCPDSICQNNLCNENFINQNVLKNINQSELSNIIENQNIMNEENYICFDGNDCVVKQKDFINPQNNTCGTSNISNYPNKIYKSYNKCYKDNIAYKYINREDCLNMPHGYGWLDGEGCMRGSPSGPNNLNSDFWLNGKYKKLYTPSNPSPYILPLYKSNYNNELY